MRVHPLSVKIFGATVEKDSAGLEKAWLAIHEGSKERSVDWWPEDLPVLLAQVDGGEGVREDQGLKVTRDRALLRVVGFGGVP
jgi:hypothetical protein